MQCAKKVMSDSPGLVDLIAIGRVNPVLNFPKGQVKFLGNSNYRRTVIKAAHQKFLGGFLKDSWASTYLATTCRNDKP